MARNVQLKAVITAVDRASGKLKSVGGALGSLSKVAITTGAAITAAIGTGFALAVREAAKFEKQMSRVKAISGATEDEFSSLTDEAKRLGKTTVFTAQEAAEGMEALAQKGFKTNEIIGAMQGTLDLAAIGQLELAESADIVSSVLRQFNIDAKDAVHIADVLAVASTSSGANVEELGESFKYIGPVAAEFGVSLEDVSAGLMALGDRGIRGSLAARTLSSSFNRLADPTNKMLEKMDELGISFYDAQGKFKGIDVVVGDLQKSFKGLTDEQRQNAISTIFGKQAFKQWSVLVGVGQDELKKLTTQLERSRGAARTMANTMLDNLAGAMTLAKSQINGAVINLGEKFLPMITRTTNALFGVPTFEEVLGKNTGNTIKEITSALKPDEIAAFGEAWKVAGDDVDEFNKYLDEIGYGNVIDGLDGMNIEITEIMQAFDEAGKSTSKFDDIVNKLSDTLFGVPSFEEILGKNTGNTIEEIQSKLNPDMIATLGKAYESAEGRVGEFLITMNKDEAYKRTRNQLAMSGISLTDVAVAFDQAGDATSKFDQILEGFKTGDFTVLAGLIKEGITTAINWITQNLPNFIKMGVEIIKSLVQGIRTNLPAISAALVSIGGILLEGFLTIAPQLIVIGIELITSLITGLAQMMPQIIPLIVNGILAIQASVVSNLPIIIQAGISIILALLNGIVQILPQLIPASVEAILTIGRTLLENLPMIIQSGVQILLALLDGLTQMLPELIPVIIEGILIIIQTILDNLPQILMAATEVIAAIIEGLADAMPLLMKYAPTIINSLYMAIVTLLPLIVYLGIKLLIELGRGIIQGIPGLISSLLNVRRTMLDKFGEIANGIVGLFLDIPQRIGEALAGLGGVLKSAVGSAVRAIPGIGNEVADLLNLAIGGPAQAGQSYIVGEQGPELFTPSVGGRVTPATQTKAVTNNMGGISINISGAGNPRAVAEEVSRYLTMQAEFASKAV